MPAELLVDTILFESSEIRDVVTEEVVDERGRTVSTITRFTCPAQRSDVKNANERVYPRKIWERICAEDSEVMERVRAGGMVGHLGHPEDGVGDDGAVSHVVRDLKLDEKGVVWATFEILDTERGKVVQEYRRKNVRFGVSSRGVGTVGADGVVQEDYQLRTFDIVLNPSTPGAYVPGISKGSVSVTHMGRRNVASGTHESEVESKKEDSAEREMVMTENKKDPFTVDPINRLRLFESDAEPFLKLDPGKVAATERNRVCEDILTLESKITSLSESDEGRTVRESAQRLARRLAEKREAIKEWKEQTTPEPEEKEDTVKVTEEEALKQKLSETEMALAEAREELRTYKELAEGLTQKNKELSEKVNELTAEVNENYQYLESAVGLITAITQVFEENKVQMAVESAIKQLPALEKFRPLLEKCNTIEELNESIEAFRSVLSSQKSVTESAPLPPPSFHAPLLVDEKEKVSDSKEEMKESAELSESVKLFRGLFQRQKQLREASLNRYRTAKSS